LKDLWILALHGWGKEFEEAAAKLQRELGTQWGGKSRIGGRASKSKGKEGCQAVMLMLTMMEKQMETSKKLWA
jgi:hypothetical protein